LDEVAEELKPKVDAGGECVFPNLGLESGAPEFRTGGVIGIESGFEGI
jgi:hypothetical protein